MQEWHSYDRKVFRPMTTKIDEIEPYKAYTSYNLSQKYVID